MLIETKFDIGDKVYYLGKDKYRIRICESEVTSLRVRVTGDLVTVGYFLYDGEDEFREDMLFASVQELLDDIGKKENIICKNPEEVIWE